MDPNLTDQEAEAAATQEAPKADGKRTASGAEEEILSEINRLGSAIVQAIQTAWASDERKKLEQDLSKGLRSLADNVEEALDKVGKNEQVHEFLDKAEDVAESVGEKVRDAKVTGEIKDGLLKGLAALTEQLQKVTKDVSARQPAESQPAAQPSDSAPTDDDEGQDIPIQGV